MPPPSPPPCSSTPPTCTAPPSPDPTCAPLDACNTADMDPKAMEARQTIIGLNYPENQGHLKMWMGASARKPKEVLGSQGNLRGAKAHLSPATSELDATKIVKSLGKTEVRSQQSSTSVGKPNPTVSQIHEIDFETQRPSSAQNPTTSRKRSLVREAIIKFSERGGPRIKNS